MLEAVPEWYHEAPKIVVKPPGPKARTIIEKTEKYVARISRGISRILQVTFDEAFGAIVKDVDGNVYIDFAGPVTCCNTGYCHPKLVEAVKRQIERFQHSYEYPTDVRAEAAELLAKQVPGNFEKKVIFCSSGTESIENAIRIAEFFTGKHEFITFWESFHGKTRGSLSLTTYGLKLRKGMTKLPGIFHVPYPDCNHCPFKLTYPECGYFCIDWIDKVITFESTDDLAAIILEPIIGGGCAVPPPGYWERIKEVCDKYNALFVDDEVQAGLCRTGKFFAIEYWKVAPDILTTGKGLAGGMPCGSTVIRADIDEKLDPDYGGFFTSTFGSNSVMMAAAVAALKIYIEERLWENAAKVGEKVIKRCQEMSEKYEVVGHIQGKGLLIGVELVQDKQKDIPSKDIALEVVKRCFERGLIIFNTGWHGGFVKICPPLSITEEQAMKGVDILEEVIAELDKEKKQGAIQFTYKEVMKTKAPMR